MDFSTSERLFAFRGWDNEPWEAYLADPVALSRSCPFKRLEFEFRNPDWRMKTKRGYAGFQGSLIHYLSPDGIQVSSEVCASLQADGSVAFLVRHHPELKGQTPFGIEYLDNECKRRQWVILSGKWLAPERAGYNEFYGVKAECVDKRPGWSVAVT